MGNLYDRISSLCSEKGIKPGRMCDTLGISRGNIGDLKAGRIKTLSAKTLTAIADYFHVTVDYLLGAPITSEGWEKAYREYLSDILPTLNRTDLNDANIDPNKLEDVADGTIALTFNLACEIADELGLTVDEMISDKNKNMPTPEAEDGLTEQESLFLSLIRRLTEDQKDFLLAQLKTLIEQEK